MNCPSKSYSTGEQRSQPEFLASNTISLIYFHTAKSLSVWWDHAINLFTAGRAKTDQVFSACFVLTSLVASQGGFSIIYPIPGKGRHQKLHWLMVKTPGLASYLCYWCPTKLWGKAWLFFYGSSESKYFPIFWPSWENSLVLQASNCFVKWEQRCRTAAATKSTSFWVVLWELSLTQPQLSHLISALKPFRNACWKLV